MTTKSITPKGQIVSLKFDCYGFYQFAKMINKYIDEIEFEFKGKELSILFIGYARIVLCKCTKSLDVIKPLKNMKFGVSIDDLAKLLKTRKGDKKEVKLIFDNTKSFIQLIKTSKKYKSIITKTLEKLDLNLDSIPMDDLVKIEYPAKVSFPAEFLNDFFYESGVYSKVVEIHINKLEEDEEEQEEDGGVIFSEKGIIGKSKYLIKEEYCSEVKGNEKGIYAYSFLTAIKPIVSILSKDDKVILHLKEDYPIKLELHISSLDIYFLIYLAPRVTEEYDDFCNGNDD